MTEFAGFSPATIRFLAALRRHNDRAWFASQKDRCEEVLLGPARDLVAALGHKLQKKRPGLIADPRTDRSIYRLNRDTRFSLDKTPYKTHLALWFWEGPPNAARLECPGFYFHLAPDFLGLSVGCYRFSDQGLAAWRARMAEPKTAARLKRLVRDLEAAGLYRRTGTETGPLRLRSGSPRGRLFAAQGILYLVGNKAPPPGNLRPRRGRLCFPVLVGRVQAPRPVV